MRDLDLWRRLDGGAVQPAELMPLAEWAAVRRAPFVGRLARLAAHADPAIRLGAVRALAGVAGVPGLRLIVGALDDAATASAAIDALREVARDAPYRYAHALFHGSAAVRREALSKIPHAAAHCGAYLRADPACADLAGASPWPHRRVELAIDLFARGQLTSAQFGDVLRDLAPGELHEPLVRELARTPAQVEAHLDELARKGTWIPAAGTDVLDGIVAALGDDLVATQRLLAALVYAKGRTLLRRAAVAIAHRFAHRGVDPALAGLMIAAEPRVLELVPLEGALLRLASRRVIELGWPVRPGKEQVDRLLRLPHVASDLAIAAAVTGLHGGGKLKRLANALGEAAIVERLVASDHGWAEICALPGETPALEIRWLARIEPIAPARYVALVARALAVLRGKRLHALVDQLQRRHRTAALLQFLATTDDAAHAAVVCGAFASRLDREGFIAMFEALHDPALARILARSTGAKALGSAMRGVEEATALRLLAAFDGEEPLPRDRELAVGAAFAERTEPALRAWGIRVSTVEEERVPLPPPPVVKQRALTVAEQERIATCPASELHDALDPARRAPSTALAPALARRTAVEHLGACVALLASVDSLDIVAAQLDRFGAYDAAFEARLDQAAATTWLRRELPPLANACLYRWEVHTLALATWIDESGGVLEVLRRIDALPGQRARAMLWRGIADVVMFLRYREPARFAREATLALARFAAERVDRDVGTWAARIVVALVEGRAVLAADVRAAVLERAADTSAATRELLARIARLDGLPEPPRVVAAPATDVLAEVRATRDLDRLVAYCHDARTAIVQEAVLALVVHGPAGLARLGVLLDELQSLAAPRPLLASIALWDDGPALERARALALGDELPAEWTFQLCVALVERGEAAFLPRAYAAANAPTLASWFRRDDWDALTKLEAPRACAIALATSPHHHAYQPAVQLLTAMSEPAPEIGEALRAFLEVDGDRPLFLRRPAAARLATAYADLAGLPLLIEELVDADAAALEVACAALPRAAHAATAAVVVDAALLGGHATCSEKRLLDILQRLPADVAAPHYGRILVEASTSLARSVAASMTISTAEADARVTRVAEVFAWGVRRGVELTGRLMRVHLTSEEKDLGYTRLDGSRIFVSALPMLRGEPHGRDIVEGLVLHELGHHAYHRGEEPQALWKQAHEEGLGHLLNLVADEHLERNLRAVDRSYGDRLKRLDAYAFHHASQELRVPLLFETLRAATAEALIASELGVAFHDQSVRVQRGAILTALDRQGHPLAKFARALRMGLGNRSDDPRVAQALALCDRKLRHLDMRGLYDLTRKLAALFGGAVSIAQVFGGAEGLSESARDEDVHGGIDDSILQREVERILDPRQGKRRTGSLGPRDRLAINVNPDEEFEKITHVMRVRGDGAEHRKITSEVARHATRLRAHLDDLGLRYVPAKARLQGRALDRTRLRALVTRGDPRILVARTPVRKTDLFLGTLIDCSGSMQAGRNIDRAKRFAALIAEAVRPLPGVEARFFGFTDSVIYDAGDAHVCDVTALRAEGGNNDAAALLHGANVALASPRRAKVLVMISDGLPTECSVAALRGLVTHLTRRRHIVCAQVAVRALEEECFPHYVVLEDAHLDVAAARFGRMIGDLARRVLAS